MAFALLARADFTEANAEATIDGSTWTALELAVSKGHTQLAAGLHAWLATMMPSQSDRSSEAKASSHSLSLVEECLQKCGRQFDSGDVAALVQFFDAHLVAHSVFPSLCRQESVEIMSELVTQMVQVCSRSGEISSFLAGHDGARYRALAAKIRGGLDYVASLKQEDSLRGHASSSRGRSRSRRRQQPMPPPPPRPPRRSR